MFTRFRLGKKVVASIFLVSASLIAGAASGQVDEEELIDLKFFRRNISQFMAACVGEPIFSPISDNVSQLTQPDSYISDTGKFASAGVANNCSILFSSTSDVSGKVIPSGKSLHRYFVTPSWLVYTSLRSFDEGEPHDFSSVLASKSIPRPVTYYADLDRSGAYEPKEQINTEGLNASQIIFEYPVETIWHQDFGDHFTRKAQYTEFGGIFLKIARFENCPLNGRGLYIVATLNGWKN